VPDYLIAPSILAANFARLGEEVDAVLAAGADMVHFDVMDNHYVPNLTVGPMVCQALRDHGVTAPIDVHLMVQPVDALIEMFAHAGATYITFHPDASHHVDRSIQLIWGVSQVWCLTPLSRSMHWITPSRISIWCY
jgi:ribulose-phosphate 3-epimerase